VVLNPNRQQNISPFPGFFAFVIREIVTTPTLSAVNSLSSANGEFVNKTSARKQTRVPQLVGV
jgi:hypothetical protein